MAIDMRLIENDKFPFEFLSRLGERESWRKELHRPIYHLHKWWAKRLGSVFRGILLGCMLPDEADLGQEFYRRHAFSNATVFDPFMGSGTTIGEAHKLGFAALGRDINPVAADAVRVALGPIDRDSIRSAFDELKRGVGNKIRELYRAIDSAGRPCDVLYYFWVMQSACPGCCRPVDLFSSWIIARNASPQRKAVVQLLCPGCGHIFLGYANRQTEICPCCGKDFAPASGTASGAKATCSACHECFTIVDAMSSGGSRPNFRLYGKLVLTQPGTKEYLPATEFDHLLYRECSRQLNDEVRAGSVCVPTLCLENGYNTRQAMRYGFGAWRDFFNDRQLLALGWLRAAIAKIRDRPTRDVLITLFSGTLEFNNLFASYKGEGTGAVRHMFAHHILKPERMPIEANVWGTHKSSGGFSNLFQRRLLRATDYRRLPTEVNGKVGNSIVCAPPFSGEVSDKWPTQGDYAARAIYLSCGDSSYTELPAGSIDLVVTDPPFFDNVHYSELADFFVAWRQLSTDSVCATTRTAAEVQDTDAGRFAVKLGRVFAECHRLLKDDGLFVFTYHHSRDEGWQALASALLGADFRVINSQPVKSEMSVATPKSQAKEPIQLDIIIACRKSGPPSPSKTIPEAIASARRKLARLTNEGFRLSRNDCKVVLFGQLLTTLRTADNVAKLGEIVLAEAAQFELSRLGSRVSRRRSSKQLSLF
jgi:putative DNA methylase